MGVPDGQLLEAILLLLDECPRPNLLFGAPAISLSLLERHMNVEPGTVNAQQAVAVVVPVSETLFPERRRPVHKALTRAGNLEGWLVFEAEDKDVGSWLRSKEAAKVDSPFPAFSQITEDRLRSGALVGKASSHSIERSPSSQSSVTTGDRRPTAAEASQQRNRTLVEPVHLGTNEHTSGRAGSLAAKTPREAGEPVELPTSDVVMRAKPKPSVLQQGSRHRPSTVASPPSAPLFPTTLHLVPTLPEKRDEVEPGLRTAVSKGEKQRKRGFLKGLLGSRRKEDEASVLTTNTEDQGGQTISAPHTGGGAPGGQRGMVRELEVSIDAEQVASHSAAKSESAQMDDARKRMAVVENASSLAKLQRTPTLRPLRLLGTRAKAAQRPLNMTSDVEDATRASPELVMQPNEAASSNRNNTRAALSGLKLIAPVGSNENRATPVGSPTLLPAQPMASEAAQGNIRQSQPFRTDEPGPLHRAQTRNRPLSSAIVGTGPEGMSDASRSVIPPSVDPVASPESPMASPHNSHSFEAESATDISGPLGSGSTTTAPADADGVEAGSESDDEQTSSITSDEDDIAPSPSTLSAPEATTFLGKAYEGLPFGPDVPALLLADWVADRWQLLTAELVAILALAYIVQASGL